ncbi:hypothetical protein [Comamonas endophytica]|uniref:Uncharacterized protein n=1 Tax=Comamonas endophytica TaxID=2949090 RepID=A0ABY6G9K6_9BURK|nr:MULTISPECIES: hypothetical protein [unclassified Acidovorax]MCD2511870.1 hypothetical protein [Acidovorax sp. D4N7]UYG51591.1 hypothetical protein M9799_16305 [Acidovorax sp. 5MLIR]
MKALRTFALLFAALSLSALPVAHAHDHDGKDKHTAQEVKADIERHQAMAAAHQAAAQCLASGKGHSVCQKELVQACKGLAIGKYCGMRHVH